VIASIKHENVHTKFKACVCKHFRTTDVSTIRRSLYNAWVCNRWLARIANSNPAGGK